MIGVTKLVTVCPLKRIPILFPSGFLAKTAQWEPMPSSRKFAKPALVVTLLAISIGLWYWLPKSLPRTVGSVDFRPYWSSTYLLAHGQDFSDPALMDDIERALTGWKEPYTMHAWFAPTGNLVLLPFTLIPFSWAADFWLLTNIAVVSLAVLLIWRKSTLNAWIPILAGFGFSMTLVSLAVGQVNTLVLLGLTLFLFFNRSNHPYAAGASLILTTVKPHLVILTLPLLVLDVIRRKEWRVLAGFGGTWVGSMLLLTLLYPNWLNSFCRLVKVGMHTLRETPTISGLLVVTGGGTWGKWIWIAAVPLAAALWWSRARFWRRRRLIDISVIAGLVVAPVGWSYDQIMLLFPILSILEWVSTDALSRRDMLTVVGLLIVTNGITFYQRALFPSEVWFFWVPFAVGSIYAFSHRRKSTLGLSTADYLSSQIPLRDPT